MHIAKIAFFCKLTTNFDLKLKLNQDESIRLLYSLQIHILQAQLNVFLFNQNPNNLDNFLFVDRIFFFLLDKFKNIAKHRFLKAAIWTFL